MSRPTLRALALAVPTLLLLACGEDPADPITPNPPAPAPAPAPPPGQASILVRVTPRGTGPEGSYAVMVDSVRAGYVASGLTARVPVDAGQHVVRFADMVPWCTAAEGEQAVEVAAGSQAIVTFTVTCTGAIVRVGTGGRAKDNDGYALSVDGDTVRMANLPLDGEALIGIPAGTRVVALARVATNCSVPSNPRTLDVRADAANELVFAVTCEGAVLRVETTTTGSERDVDGYAAVARYSAAGGAADTGRIGIADARAIGDRWRPGTEVTVALGDVADNCQSDAASRSVAIPSLDTVTVRFAVTCAALPEPGILLSAYSAGLNGDGVYRYVAQLDKLFKVSTGGDAEWAPGATAMVTRGTDGLIVTDRGSGVSRVLTNGQNPRFSPDGRRLLYLQAYGCPWGCNYPDRVSVVDLDGPLPQPGTAARIAGVAAFDLSADGATIAAVVDESGYYSGSLAVYPVDGGAPRTLLTPLSFGLPVMTRFSPDGRELLVQQAFGGYVVPLDGSPPRQLVSGLVLAWSPDGSRILVGLVSGSDTQVGTVRSSDGGDFKALTTVPGRVYAASWPR